MLPSHLIAVYPRGMGRFKREKSLIKGNNPCFIHWFSSYPRGYGMAISPGGEPPGLAELVVGSLCLKEKQGLRADTLINRPLTAIFV